MREEGTEPPKKGEGRETDAEKINLSTSQFRKKVSPDELPY